MNITRQLIPIILAARLFCAIPAIASDAVTVTSDPVKASLPASNLSTQALIEVEVHFFETSSSNMMELGCQWLLNQPDPRQNTNNAAAKTSAAQQPRATVKIGPRKNIKGLRYMDGAPTNTGTSAGKLNSVFNFPVTDSQAALILQALEHKCGMNLLSAPKITTRSGQNAEVKVVRELIYPAEYQIETFVKNMKNGMLRPLASNETVKPPETLVTALGIPKFETREMGVILNVTPLLESDGKTILLDIDAEICELVEWIDYGTGKQLVDGDLAPLQMRQPLFHSRKIITNISMLDGQTAVMGGLVTTDKEEHLDQTPFFGSIPFLGRLFQHKTTQVVNKNLLILITANIKNGN